LFPLWDALALAEPEPSTLADAPGVCALWLALAPALACPGVTDAFPEAEPLAEVCADISAIAVIVNKPAVIAAIQNFLMFNSFLSLSCKSVTSGDLWPGFTRKDFRCNILKKRLLSN
jgi:hypothetical protein